MVDGRTGGIIVDDDAAATAANIIAKGMRSRIGFVSDLLSALPAAGDELGRPASGYHRYRPPHGAVAPRTCRRDGRAGGDLPILSRREQEEWA